MPAPLRPTVPLLPVLGLLSLALGLSGVIRAAAAPTIETLPGFADEIVKARKREGLPVAALSYIERIQEFTGAPVRAVGVGPDREQTIRM